MTSSLMMLSVWCGKTLITGSPGEAGSRMVPSPLHRDGVGMEKAVA